MLFNKVAIAAFVALVQQVTAAPVDIDARTQRTGPVFKDNDGNTFVYGTAKGGDGGSNSANNGQYAAPIVKTWGKNTGHIYQPVAQSNEAYQSANGGAAIVAGNMARDFEERTYPYVSDNDWNTVVVGSATGGKGGSNSADNWSVAKPKVFTGGKNTGHINNGVAQSNVAYQSADGGSAKVVGNYARDLASFETRHLTEELEARGWTFPSFINNDDNTAVVGSATGGKGGTNSANNHQTAKPIVFSGGRNKGTINNGVNQSNYAEQYADGGSAAVIGNAKRYLEERTGCSCAQPNLISTGPVLSGNDRNTFVKGDATGGKGGTNNANNVNTAVPIVVSAGKNDGTIKNGVTQSNYAEQSADGGSAAVIGNSRG